MPEPQPQPPTRASFEGFVSRILRVSKAELDELRVKEAKKKRSRSSKRPRA